MIDMNVGVRLCNLDFGPVAFIPFSIKCLNQSHHVSSYISHLILYSQGLQESVFAHFGILQDAGSVEQTDWTWTSQLEVGLKQSPSVLERGSEVFRRFASLDEPHHSSVAPRKTPFIYLKIYDVYIYIHICIYIYVYIMYR